MPATKTTTIEQLALEGPIQLSLAIGLGLICLAVFGWALWREQSVLGRRYAILFFFLRCTAIATVFWLLLAPTNVRVESSKTRKTVALLADVSGSMQTVGPHRESDHLRWAISASATWKKTATEACDQALAASGMAKSCVELADEAVRRHEPQKRINRLLSKASRALQRTRSHFQTVEQAFPDERNFTKFTAQARDFRQVLEGGEFRAFAQLCVALEKNRTPSQERWRESLPDLLYQLSDFRVSLRDFAHQVAKIETERTDRQQQQQMENFRRMSRGKRVAHLLDRLNESGLESIREQANIRFHAFAGNLIPLTDSQSPQEALSRHLKSDGKLAVQPTGGTDLSSALEQLHREQQARPLAAVILLSDMAHNQENESDPREVALKLGKTPVHVVPIGDTERRRDVDLQSVSTPSVAMRNDNIVIEVNLRAHKCQNETTVVKLMQEGNVIDFHEVSFDSAFCSRKVRFDHRVRSVGRHSFQVAVDPLEEEATEQNNYGTFDVNVTRSDIKVLLADEMPRWEYRYLAQLFRRDAKVDCDELLFQPRVIATGDRAENESVPMTVDAWDRYDVVMIGDLSPEHLPGAAQQSLSDYLSERGGTLVVIAGSNAMPQAYADDALGKLLPVEKIGKPVEETEVSYAFQVTSEGKDHDALMIGETDEETRSAWDFVNRFSPLHQLSPWRKPKPAAHTLISAVPQQEIAQADSSGINAFLCWQQIGRGRIVYLSGPDTYRLRLLRGDRYHYRFWGQLMRWAIASDLAVGSELVRIRTDSSRYTEQETVHVTVRLTDRNKEPVVNKELTVQICSEENDRRTVPLKSAPDVPGEYHAIISPLTSGVYRLEPSGEAITELQQTANSSPTATSFTVQASPTREMVDVRCDRALAEQIANVTGGLVIPPTALKEVLELIDVEPIISERIERTPLWVEWKYLWIVFGCLQIEWILRKWKGLS